MFDMFDWAQRLWAGFWRLWFKTLVFVFLFTFALTSVIAIWRHVFH